MKNKLVKSMSMIIAIAMLIAMVPAVVSADTLTTIGTVSVEIGEVNETTGSAQVTVTASDINGEMTDYTLLALRSTDEVAVADLATMEDGDLEAQIEYIDQDDATLSEGKLTASFTLRGADLAEMKTRTNEYGDVITVLLGGTGVEAKGGKDTYELPKTDAPALTVDESAVWLNDEVVISYAGATAAEWETKTLTVTVDGETVSAEVDDENDDIIISGLEIGEYDVVEVAESTDEYKVATLGTDGTTLFEVKSRVAAAKAAGVFGGITDAYDTDDNSVVDTNQCWITVPALEVTTDVEPIVTITYTLPEEVTDVITIEDGAEGAKIIKVARPEATATEALTVTITADIAAVGESNDTATKTYTIRKIGDDGLNITADDVTILKASNAYANPTKALIKVVTSEVNAAESTLMVGDAELYWSSQKNAFYGVVPTTINDEAITTATLAEALKNGVVAEPSDSFYFGVPKSGLTSPVGTDLGFAGRTTLNGENPTAIQYIAMDCASAEADGVFAGTDLGAIGRATLGTRLPVLPAE